MTLETRDVLTIFSLLVAAASILLVNRNARRSAAVQARAAEAQAQNVELTRIRDLRHELAETKTELDVVKAQVTELARQSAEASAAANQAFQWRFEALRYARMPGMDMDAWLARFDAPPGALDARIEP